MTQKQERYLQKDGKTDWIDECAGGMSTEQFRGAMMFTIGKYFQRMGKKDPIEMEQAKIADYAKRWREYEQQIGGDLAMVDGYIAKLENGE